MHVASLRSDGDSDLRCGIGDVECRSLVNAREEPSPKQQHYLGRRVSNRNVNAFAILPIGITPDDSDPVGRVLARKSERSRHERRPNLLEPNHADSGDRMFALELGPQPIGQLPGNDLRVYTEVDQHAALDHPMNRGKQHDEKYAIGLQRNAFDPSAISPLSRVVPCHSWTRRRIPTAAVNGLAAEGGRPHDRSNLGTVEESYEEVEALARPQHGGLVVVIASPRLFRIVRRLIDRLRKLRS